MVMITTVYGLGATSSDADGIWLKESVTALSKTVDLLTASNEDLKRRLLVLEAKCGGGILSRTSAALQRLPPATRKDRSLAASTSAATVVNRDSVTTSFVNATNIKTSGIQSANDLVLSTGGTKKVAIGDIAYPSGSPGGVTLESGVRLNIQPGTSSMSEGHVFSAGAWSIAQWTCSGGCLTSTSSYKVFRADVHGMGLLMLKASSDSHGFHCRCTRMMWLKATSVETISNECYSACGTISVTYSSSWVYIQKSLPMDGFYVSGLGDMHGVWSDGNS